MLDCEDEKVEQACRFGNCVFSKKSPYSSLEKDNSLKSKPLLC